MNARAASLLGLRVGELVPVGFYTDAQAGSPGYGTARVRPVVRIEARITGLVEFNDELVQDDADRPQGDLLFTPALTKTLLAAGTSSGISWYGLKLDGGAGSVPAVEREVDARLGAGGAAWFRVTSADEAQVQSSDRARLDRARRVRRRRAGRHAARRGTGRRPAGPGGRRRPDGAAGAGRRPRHGRRRLPARPARGGGGGHAARGGRGGGLLPRRADRPGAAGLPGTGSGVRLDRPRRRVPAAGLRFRRGRGDPGGTRRRPAGLPGPRPRRSRHAVRRRAGWPPLLGCPRRPSRVSSSRSTQAVAGHAVPCPPARRCPPRSSR